MEDIKDIDYREYFFGIKNPVTYKDGKFFYNGRIVTDNKAGLQEPKVFYSEGKYYNKSDNREASFEDLIDADKFNLLTQQTEFVCLERFVSKFNNNNRLEDFKTIKKNINAIKDLLEIAQFETNEKLYIELRRKVYLDLIKLKQEEITIKSNKTQSQELSR